MQRKLLELAPAPSLAKVVHEALELPKGGDVADFIDRYKGWAAKQTHDAVQEVLDDAKPIGIVGDYDREMEEIIAGKRKAFPFGPWGGLSAMARALMPGTVTCIFGPAGSTKSLFITEALVEWVSLGIKACVYMLEDDRNYHLRRAHAQVAENSHITDNEWVEHNPDAIRRSREQFRQTIEDIGLVIWDAPNDEVSYEMLTTWVEERAKAGYEIIMIDPVTAVQPGGKVWEQDQKFIFAVKTLARRHNTRIVLVTHPRKSQKPVMVGLDDMAGGAAYQRFSHTVLLLERNDKDEEFAVTRGLHMAPEIMAPNRILRIAKARNGPGAGKRIAFNFNGDTLRFDELGLVEKSQ